MHIFCLKIKIAFNFFLRLNRSLLRIQSIHQWLTINEKMEKFLTLCSYIIFKLICHVKMTNVIKY